MMARRHGYVRVCPSVEQPRFAEAHAGDVVPAGTRIVVDSDRMPCLTDFVNRRVLCCASGCIRHDQRVIFYVRGGIFLEAYPQGDDSDEIVVSGNLFKGFPFQGIQQQQRPPPAPPLRQEFLQRVRTWVVNVHQGHAVRRDLPPRDMSRMNDDVERRRIVGVVVVVVVIARRRREVASAQQ